MHSRTGTGGGLFVGTVLLVWGTLILLLNLGVLTSVLFKTWWPLILIAAGAAKLVYRATWYRHRKPYSDFA